MMDAKKDETRFTIKFNPVNPRHREAIRILNEAGRGKASLIADAICMYIHYGADMGADLLRCGIPTIQDAKVCKISKVSKSDDDALLNALVDSAEMFFG